MVWWQWLGICWVALGLGIIIVAELAAHRTGSTALISANDWPASIGACLAVTIGAPLVAIYVLCICSQMICRGRIPVSSHAWWPARAKKFPDVEPPHSPGAGSFAASPETLLCQLIEIRHRKIPPLHRGEAPENWPMWMLWKTTEAAILDIVEQYYWLCDGGLAAQEALQKIDAAQSRIPTAGLGSTSTLRSYLAARLKTDDPGYVALGHDILSESVDIAESWSYARIAKIKADRPYPPSEWLKARVDACEIEAEVSLPFKDGGLVMVTDGVRETPGTTVPIDRKWHRIALRMVPGDELWTFSSPPEYWQGLAGRMGVALIRNGHPIGHVTTMMN